MRLGTFNLHSVAAWTNSSDVPGARGRSFIVHNAEEPRDYSYLVRHKSVILGSSEKIVNDLGGYCLESGIGNVIWWVNMGCQPHRQVMNSLQRLGDEVFPKLRGVWPSHHTLRSVSAKAV